MKYMLSMILVVLAGLGAVSAAGAEHPCLVYTNQDREKLLKLVRGDKAVWTPNEAEDAKKGPVAAALYGYWKGIHDRFLAPTYLWEGNRAEALLNLSVVLWVEPGLKMPESFKPATPRIETLLEAARVGIKSITIPEGRQGPNVLGPGAKNQWSRTLEASAALWNYAVAFDMLSAPQVRDAGLEPEALNDFYRKIADGVFHILTDHLREHQRASKPQPENNWLGKELAGLGMTCLAMRERFEAEPAGSQRRKDYDECLQMVRDISKKFLDDRAEMGDPRCTYYYESPHYFRYWVEAYLPFAVAHNRMYPETKERWPFMALSPEQPLGRFLRGCTVPVAFTHIDSGYEHKDSAGNPGFSAFPLDDSWTKSDDTGVPCLMAAAWMNNLDEAGRKLYLNLAKYTDTRSHPLLLASTAIDDVAKFEKQPLPTTEAIFHSGIAVCRTGSEPDDVMAVLKNTWTQRAKDGSGEPSVSGHTHSDNGEICAYRACEPILVDPGYGAEGPINPHLHDWFNNWNRHNLLMVEEKPGYSKATRELVGETGDFILPAWTEDKAPPKRITRCEELCDAFGTLRVMETETPYHFRMVLVPDKTYILVIDRLKMPHRIKLAWWGNGSDGNAPPPPKKKDKKHEAADDATPDQNSGDSGDAAKKATGGVTTKFDLKHADAEFLRGPALATRIHVVSPAAQETEIVPGEYGPGWSQSLPLTGMHVASKEAVHFAVTLIETRTKPKTGAATFTLNAEAAADESGNLKSVTVTGGDSPVTYSIKADGGIERSH